MITGMEPTHFESLYPETSREAEIAKILSFIKEGNSCQLIGLPGSGRANLFGLLAYNRNVRIKHLGENQKWFHFVLINFSEVRKKPLFEATKFIFLNLIDSLRERKAEEYQKASDIFKESLQMQDELVLFQGLKHTLDHLAIEKELTVVFLFDRFEEYVPMLTPEFFANLRVLRNRAKYRFSVVFSLPRPLEDLLEPMLFADFYEFVSGHTVFLPLEDKTGTEFRIAYLEKVSEKKLDPTLIAHTLELTAGHGKLTRLSIESLLALQDTPPKTKDALQEYLLEQKTVQGTILELWHSLSPFEQTYLEHPPYGEQNPYLEHIYLLKNGGIAIPLFNEFLKAHLAKQTPQTIPIVEHITFDTNTLEVKKGETLLSDRLTSLEFRLLRFLLENQDRILERNDIIPSVWKDNQSAAGVTDQALDQLMFRLRKKIEDDPNNPIHLQTIKGRGFKFTA